MPADVYKRKPVAKSQVRKWQVQRKIELSPEYDVTKEEVGNWGFTHGMFTRMMPFNLVVQPPIMRVLRSTNHDLPAFPMRTLNGAKNGGNIQVQPTFMTLYSQQQVSRSMPLILQKLRDIFVNRSD
jgi:hypothetical protein